MWIKICGVTSVADAVMIASAGADAVGLNFYAPSKRYVGVNTAPDAVLSFAREVRDAVADNLDVVGVFVNSTAQDVVLIATSVALDVVQFHGDESPELILEFHNACPDISIIRAFRIGDDGTSAMDAHLSELAALNVPLEAVLVDAFVDGEYGGTGHTVNSEVVNAWKAASGKNYRLILAGGLTPDNVASAARSVQPWGIDTASGVESAAGIKCLDKVQAFVKQVRTVAGAAETRLRDD